MRRWRAADLGGDRPFGLGSSSAGMWSRKGVVAAVDPARSRRAGARAPGRAPARHGRRRREGACVAAFRRREAAATHAPVDEAALDLDAGLGRQSAPAVGSRGRRSRPRASRAAAALAEIGAEGLRDEPRRAAACASAPRAAASICHSSCAAADRAVKAPSGRTTMRAPASRGRRALAACTVTSAARPCPATIRRGARQIAHQHRPPAQRLAGAQDRLRRRRRVERHRPIRRQRMDRVGEARRRREIASISGGSPDRLRAVDRVLAVAPFG